MAKDTKVVGKNARALQRLINSACTRIADAAMTSTDIHQLAKTLAALEAISPSPAVFEGDEE